MWSRPDFIQLIGAGMLGFGGPDDDILDDNRPLHPTRVRLGTAIDLNVVKSFDLARFERELAIVADSAVLVLQPYKGDAPVDVVGLVTEQRADIAFAPCDRFERIAASLSAFRLPYLFASPEEGTAALSRRVVDDVITTETLDRSLRLLAAWWDGNRTLTSARRPIERPADLAGMTVGILSDDDLVAKQTFAALGATTVAVDRAHRYDRLHDGSVDAVEDTLESIATGKYYESFKHVALTGHAFQLAALAIDTTTFDRLSHRAQAAFAAAAVAGAADAIAPRSARDAAIVEQLTATGVAITRPDPPAFARATRDLYAQFAPAHYGRLFLDGLYASAHGPARGVA